MADKTLHEIGESDVSSVVTLLIKAIDFEFIAY